MRGLTGKVAIVTGAGGAIGRAISLRLAAEGVAVAIFDRDARGAEQTAVEIERNQGKAAIELVDITSHEKVKAAVGRIEASLGPVDILVNNAGWDRVGNFLSTEPALWEQLIAINLTGPLNLHHTVVAGMVERQRGKVVNIASDAGRVGSSGEAVYAACKGGIIAFSKTLARETARANINVNVVCPGPTDTPLFASFVGEGDQGKKIYEALKRAIPFRRIGTPEDIAGVVAFLASDDASYMTGQVISVSGGLTMVG